MPYHYLDATRESDPHALPDVETFDARECCCSECETLYPDIHHQCPECDAIPRAVGHWGFWYAYLDGGLDAWSSDPCGPFESEASALAAARGGVE